MKIDPLEELRSALPPLIPRERVAELTGGLVASKTLANADGLRLGPARRVRIGRKVCYPRADFLAWLAARLRIEERAA